MDQNAIIENLKKLEYLAIDEINEIADKMGARWENLKSEWGDPFAFDGLPEAKYKDKIKELGNCFALYLTEKVKEKTVENIYDNLFSHVEPAKEPFLIIVAGAIASGKSTVVDCVIPEKYGSNYGLVDKDKIKASNIFREFIHAKFGDEHGNLIEDFMLGLRDAIGETAIKNKKNILLEQSCKTEDFLTTCKLAKKEYGFKIYAEVVVTPIAFTCARNVYRYVTGLIKDPKSARYEAFINISDTYANAPKVLTKLKEEYADAMTVYTSDILKVETENKTVAEIFDEVANGPVSDISVEIASKIFDFINANIGLVEDNPDIMHSLGLTKQKLLQLAKNPEMVVTALPQDWQPPKAREMLDKLNAPLGFCYSERLRQNAEK